MGKRLVVKTPLQNWARLIREVGVLRDGWDFFEMVANLENLSLPLQGYTSIINARTKRDLEEQRPRNPEDYELSVSYGDSSLDSLLTNRNGAVLNPISMRFGALYPVSSFSTSLDFLDAFQEAGYQPNSTGVRLHVYGSKEELGYVLMREKETVFDGIGGWQIPRALDLIRHDYKVISETEK